jgi:SNF2 family DNA or RNA helicase
MSKTAKYRLIMNGTAMTNGIVDLYSQITYLSTKILGYRSFNQFSESHLRYRMVKNDLGKWVSTNQIDYEVDSDDVFKKIEPYIFKASKDDLGLPDRSHSYMYNNLTQEQQEAIFNIKQEFEVDVYRYDASQISIPLFRLFSRMETILCGWYRKGKDIVRVNHTRLDLLCDIVESIGNRKVIIWTKYRRHITEIKQRIEKITHVNSCAIYSGKEKNEELERWRKDSNCNILLSTQSSGGYSLTLNEAEYSIYYANGFDYGKRKQSLDRNYRIGQGKKTYIIDIYTHNSFDDKIKNSVEFKQSYLEYFNKFENDRNKIIEKVRTL